MPRTFAFWFSFLGFCFCFPACEYSLQIPNPSKEPNSPPPPAVSSVFSALSVSLSVTRYSSQEYTKRDPQTFAPLLVSNLGITIFVGGGRSSFRDRGLRIFAGSREISETPSAASPSVYSYQFYTKEGDLDQPIPLAFEWKGEKALFTVAPLRGTILSPTPETSISSTEPLQVHWEEQENARSSAEFDALYYDNQRSGACAVLFKKTADEKGQALFASSPAPLGHGPPCVGEIRVLWTSEEKPASPFQSLTLTRSSSKIQRIQIR